MAKDRSQRELDLVVWGATGFAGACVARYLARAKPPIRWALGGRNREKLEQLRATLPGCEDLPLVVSDAQDSAALDAWVPTTRVIATTVGPYVKYGRELAEACARHGTHYCDLAGEVPYIRWLIDTQHARATESGACFIPASGFDSVPSDLGVWMVQQPFRQTYGAPATQVRMVVEAMRGGLGGGTLDSMLSLLESTARDPAVKALVENPYALDPEPERTQKLDPSDTPQAKKDPDTGEWLTFFPMSPINTRVVRRTNALLGDAWGRGFEYEELMRVGEGVRGAISSWGVAKGMGMVDVLGATGLGRGLMRRALPKPGEGPSDASLDKGFFRIRFVARGGNGGRVDGKVECQLDPGFRGTALMLAESALAILELDEKGTLAPGVQTPASALNATLLERLKTAGMTWEARVR